MERIVYRKTLDVHKNGIQFTLQGFETADNMARKIEISLMASGDTIDLPLEQITAVMYVTTPNATGPSTNECTIKDNTIIYDVLPIVEEGITEMQLKLIETGLDGAKGVLAAPRFAVEVTQSNTDDESATQTPTFTALEDAVAKAKGVYDSRLIGIEISKDFTFRAKYADGTIYESDVLKELSLHGDVLLSQSYAKGGTGIRAGEDTDNSMYYSNVSRSASAEASRVSEESAEILEEVQKHGVYTSFSVNFDTGEVEYISPAYEFKVNKESGELEAHGETYTPDATVEAFLKELGNIELLYEFNTGETMLTVGANLKIPKLKYHSMYIILLGNSSISKPILAVRDKNGNLQGHGFDFFGGSLYEVYVSLDLTIYSNSDTSYADYRSCIQKTYDVENNTFEIEKQAEQVASNFIMAIYGVGKQEWY